MNKYVFLGPTTLLSIALLFITEAAAEPGRTTPLAPAGPEVTCDDITQIPEQECLALQAFYDSTNGGEWGNWFSTSTPCDDWDGVDCRLPGNVRYLLLEYTGITGSIPPELGDLSLFGLDLGGNHLWGSIPPEFGNLTSLAALDLSRNKLAGDIPGTITNLFDLGSQDDSLLFQGVDLGYNMLSASDPAVIDFLSDDHRDPDWDQTQTIPPTDLMAEAQSSTSVQLTWTPIPYTEDGGYYEIIYATSPDGIYSFHGHTDDKSANGYLVDGLNPDTAYRFAVRTHTPAHYYYFGVRPHTPAQDYQPNDLWSEFGPIVSATTYKTCYRLTSGHTGSGLDPTAFPPFSPGCSAAEYRPGTAVTLSAMPSLGWFISGWSGTDDDNSTVLTNTLTTSNSDHTAVVHYAHGSSPCYNLTLTHTGSGLDPTAFPPMTWGCLPGRYKEGEIIRLNAMPVLGWRVSGWSGTEDDSETGLDNTLIMPAGAHTVTVHYAEDTGACYRLNLTHTGSGEDPTAPYSSWGCSEGEFKASASINLHARPAMGWTVGSWSGTDDDGSLDWDNHLTMPSSVHTVTVDYVQAAPSPPMVCYVLTLDHEGPGGNPVASPTHTMECSDGYYATGQVISLAADPASGCATAAWSGTDDDASTAISNTLTMPNANRTVTVYYAYRTYLPLVIRDC